MVVLLWYFNVLQFMAVIYLGLWLADTKIILNRNYNIKLD